ncbi:hypothetical protein C5E07_17365 [Pseudoclavibacter sp. RFBJ3]|uniref:metallophosphoesterase family protein n=1 Tax=unclassified Pseudoclavibacter TaxID=2615177 RepID=UPI000CE7F8E6|nr:MULTISPECIES: metallophosphoesterase [unclassified Pseudoclavibacter]PPF86067.1 hypothetical protein C5C12_02810 [Pseudoclavibacter sp. RFBJ5]PPF89769.1 hypothetical protein C5E07_17365 [Pseudoclavibacter sp. RFBJ3]PPF97339.1 hypothetical protein C5C19_12235 [Pseudoclavibacter sp. RFBH5]PPG19655.1 hypothetical protein C5E13_16250 [Pseudoclavibacter sp. RFBI4]
MVALRVAVLADIHSDQNGGSWTHVYAEPPAARPGHNPLADLVSFVRSEGINADYLLAVGDIANRANAVGLEYGWRRAHGLAADLGAHLLGVPGNHDVVTHDEVADPREALRALLPGFPTGDTRLDDHFWTRGWALIENADHRVLLIDSTLDFPPHPGAVRKNSKAWREYLKVIDRGGFLDRVEDEISEALAGLGEKLNIAVVHHHPMEHQFQGWLQDEYGPMRRGSELVELLAKSTQSGRWLMVHGHKHVPQLVQATNLTSNGPIVLCGASIGAKLWDPINTVTRNQFHIMTVRNDYDEAVPGLAGTIESYTWGYGIGWQVSERSGSGLPAAAGFGSNEHFRVLATKVERALGADASAFMSYEALLGAVPQLPYVLPADWEFLESELEQRGVGFSRDRANRLVQISRIGAKA